MWDVHTQHHAELGPLYSSESQVLVLLTESKAIMTVSQFKIRRNPQNPKASKQTKNKKPKQTNKHKKTKTLPLYKPFKDLTSLKPQRDWQVEGSDEEREGAYPVSPPSRSELGLKHFCLILSQYKNPDQKNWQIPAFHPDGQKM